MLSFLEIFILYYGWWKDVIWEYFFAITLEILFPFSACEIPSFADTMTFTFLAYSFILVEYIHSRFLEKLCKWGKIFEIMHDDSVSSYRILGWKIFLLRILIALHHYLLTSSGLLSRLIRFWFYLFCIWGFSSFWFYVRSSFCPKSFMMVYDLGWVFLSITLTFGE